MQIQSESGIKLFGDKLFIFLPIKLKTSFIKSLKPRREFISNDIFVTFRRWSFMLVRDSASLPWSVKFNVEVSFPLSSFRTTSYTPESFLEIWQREQERQIRSSRQQQTRNMICIHLKRQAFSSAMDAAENTYMTQEQKSQNRQTNKHLFKKKKAFSGRTAKPEVAVGPWRQQITVPNF